jgi:DNA-directed RNA polymerase specialized sigma24 family protein
MGPRRAPDWRRLQRALRAKSARETETTLQVALLIEFGLPQAEIAERLGIPMSEVKACVNRLRAIAPQLEREQRDW